MISIRIPNRAQVTYRATLADGREAELRLIIDPASASVADAWDRLTAAHEGVDPRTLEVEIRQVPRLRVGEARRD